ncbi:pyruvoyl-dependent arginine decarboxylase [Thermodesulfobacteriota bacterium]
MFGRLPKSFFLASGVGDSTTELNAFDAALLDAGIGDTNLVRLSSILPPSATLVTFFDFPKGSLVPLAYGEFISSDPGTLISASIAVGIPRDDSEAGLIMEHSHIGDPDGCEQIAREMVREGMENVRGLDIERIMSVSSSHTVARVGAVFAAVVLCP